MRPWEVAVVALGGMVGLCLLGALAFFLLRRHYERKRYAITDVYNLEARQRAKEEARRRH